ncbi:hypothetical protein [uncultured Methylobacterium sp.]|uniref:hypothetical protein n=1 Tax=uncultured Methylobacterium sp. TaxID=157278 RepID=UPI0035CBF6EF
MPSTFRACYFLAADAQSDVLLTTEEQAQLSDADLTEAAVAEAHRADLIGDAHPGTTEADLRAGLVIGDYTLA